jgi:hypothetical protein
LAFHFQGRDLEEETVRCCIVMMISFQKGPDSAHDFSGFTFLWKNIQIIQFNTTVCEVWLLSFEVVFLHSHRHGHLVFHSSKHW